MEQVTLHVTGMHCDGCAAAIDRSLRGLEGVHRSHADYARGEVAVAFDPARTNAKALRTRVERAGFAITDAGTDAGG